MNVPPQVGHRVGVGSSSAEGRIMVVDVIRSRVDRGRSLYSLRYEVVLLEIEVALTFARDRLGILPLRRR